MKRVLKEDIKVSVKKDKNQNRFTDRILNNACDISLDNHHEKNANSKITITSKN